MDRPGQLAEHGIKRSDSMSQKSETSQTAQDYIASQLSLEADAREALPYQFDTCTKPLGPLRQSVYACLTCSPPPASVHQKHVPAGVCYSCSISCHGEHNLVELFEKRDFECDCGTTRFANSRAPCQLRHNPEIGRKGGVINEEARPSNKYNQNFEGKFCGCGDEYDPEKEKGTMFQCLGLGTVDEGGCGEDWWHPECLIGLPRIKDGTESKPKFGANGSLATVVEGSETEAARTNAGVEDMEHSDEQPLPSGFPSEDDFDHVLCYKCTDAFPLIKSYAASEGFLTATTEPAGEIQNGHSNTAKAATPQDDTTTKKRKAQDDSESSRETKRSKASPSAPDLQSTETPNQPLHSKHTTLPPPPLGPTSIFLTEDFRDHLCRCPTCFLQLRLHPQLLEEEDSYSPPLSTGSTDEADNPRAGSIHSGSLLERGEAALSNMDRVRAIEGVMAYNHVKDKVKAFLKPFAESGQAVGAEDIKEYFARLRGDEMQARGENGEGGDGEVDQRKEQKGF